MPVMKDLRFGGLVDIGRGRLVDRAAALHRDGASLVDRFADDVHDAPERAFADRNRDRAAGVGDFLPAHETFGNVHGDAAHRVLAKLLGDFEHEAVPVVVRLEGVENRRQIAVELHVDDGADHLGDAAGGVGEIGHCDVLVLSKSSLGAAPGGATGLWVTAPPRRI